ncbi:Helix-hairpin-helix DNA-binding motif-containing protein [Pseudomonas syringae pv. coryli]|uniref:Helix-hairpin-helix DNA-binding motif-containing protein n=2 Tax=Pseudomonas syringae pv. coryli TaxID=317659 RepID=A0A0P9MW80_9PSED|nr:Helix-hairpin-helix DNA-binding motif-containing protein [Pseudomonas syringae pv. coryli]
MSTCMHKENSQRPPVLQHVSQNVRRLRNSADLSQTALAEKSGVSRRMLVAIEVGEKNVSLATLDRVAEALEVAFSDLIQAPENRDYSRINELAWAGTIAGSKAVLLARAVARREVELWEFCLQPGDAYVSEADPDGWSEQVYVVEGHLTLRFADPAAIQQIGAGEFFMFPSNQPHRYCNDADVPLRFVRNVVL